MTKTVLVTGASGFLASYIISELLSHDYTVHGTLRNLARSKDEILGRYPAEQRDRLKLFEVKDLVKGDGLEDAMKGCDGGVLHTASPYQLTVEDPMKDFIEPAVEGTLTVLKTALSLGISRVVITSSFAAVTDFSKGGPFRSYTYTSHDWNPTTLSEAVSPGKPGPFVYSASKTLAEQAAHEFSKENPSVSVTSMNPPMIYSSPLPGTVKDKKGINTSSNAIYGVIEGDKDREVPWNRLPLFCATEDVAKAHRKALEVDVEKVRGQRFLLCGGAFTWEDAIRHLSRTKPSLKPRLPKLVSESDPTRDRDHGREIAKLDCTPAKEVLGMGEFKGWKEVLEGTVEGLLEIEKGFEQREEK
ncbi:hypothetical protein JCM16303_006155 [Sporobolomyces ruberrimus]